MLAATVGEPHVGQRVVEGGAPFARARVAVLMAHGRGGSPEDMLRLAEVLALPDVAWLAPAAASGSWWPASFLAPIGDNEPGLSSGLAALDRLTEQLDRDGFGPERVVLMGFSQGACLALEYAARSGRAFQAVIGLSGGLVGTGEAAGLPSERLYGHTPKQFTYPAQPPGSQVLLGCHERDPHIPLARVQESAAMFEKLGAEVQTQILAGAGHGVVDEELRAVRSLLNRGVRQML